MIAVRHTLVPVAVGALGTSATPGDMLLKSAARLSR